MRIELKHFHLFCGLGGGAKGFNRGRANVGSLEARYRCIGGIDNDPASIHDFSKKAGVAGTVMDLFSREQYIRFHGREPDGDWREATPDDIRRAAGNEFPNVVFLSAPCKGFSGLLSQALSTTEKYQALNELTVRGIWLMLEAFKDDLPEHIVFENVPRIANRGRPLLDQIVAVLRSYGYAVAETTHDCGEIGGLAQSRRRFLLVARNEAKVPAFLYEPDKRPLKACGEILGRMALPGDDSLGPMHRIPRLQWKTWVRLAFVEAGRDWRSLNRLEVEDGYLKDFLIVPDYRRGFLGVHDWNNAIGAVCGESLPTNGAFSVADPRHEGAPKHHNQFRIVKWERNAQTVTGAGAKAQCVADPRNHNPKTFSKYAVTPFDGHAGTVIGGDDSGAYAVADPRHRGTPKHCNEYRVTQWDREGMTITGAHGSGQCIADPRFESSVKWNDGQQYGVRDWTQHVGAISGQPGPAQGPYSIADPRAPESVFQSKYPVTEWSSAAGTVISGSTTGQGAYAVQDPRPGMSRSKGDHYLTAGHYGVIPWASPTGAVSAAASHDNGGWSVADPRLPKASEHVVAQIISLDGTWHRPFTTLELAALQGLYDPEDDLYLLHGSNDGQWRERIGNAVPPPAAEAIASMMAESILLSRVGETFQLRSTPVWVRPLAIGLSVDQRIMY